MYPNGRRVSIASRGFRSTKRKFSSGPGYRSPWGRGGRGGRHGRGRGRGGGRGRGRGFTGRNNRYSWKSRKKKTPAKPKGPSHKKLTKNLRTAANAVTKGTGDAEGIFKALENAQNWGLTQLDGTTVQQVAVELCRTGKLDTALELVSKMKSGSLLSPAGVTQILAGLPASVPIEPLKGAEFVSALVERTVFVGGGGCKHYFHTRCRWVVLEYLQETLASRDKVSRIPSDVLIRMGHCAILDTVEKSLKGDGLVFRNIRNHGPRVEEGRRGLTGGDLVQIRFIPESPSVDGVGGNSTVPPQLCVEATVDLAMPLICTPVLKSDTKVVLDRAQQAGRDGVSKGHWRIDRLGNNVQFQRQLRAVSILASRTSDRTTSGATPTQTKTPGGKNDPRPAYEISLAITDSCVTLSPASDRPPDDSTAPLSTSDLCNRSCLDRFGAPMRAAAPNGYGIGRIAGLNPSQLAAVNAATTRRLTLVQGPPGTGKTQVSVRLLQYWARSRVHATTVGGARGCVLACSDSNIAVDNILMGLVKCGVRAVRLGRPENTRSDLLQYCVDEITGTMLENSHPSNGAGNSSGSMKQAKHLAKMRVLNRAQVICCTCIGAGSHVLDKMRFAAVLIDEAGQATELSTIVPLTRGCQQLVLVGDHYQLPPTVTSDDAKREGICVSLFERLARCGVRTELLDTQYRMHPAISQFASDCFYGGRIKDGISGRDRPAPHGFRWPHVDFPVAFLDVPRGSEREDQGSGSKYNTDEADLVMQIIADLVRYGRVLPEEIGIVTPYAAQVRLLRRLRDQQRLRDVECASVDGFQGREKRVIVMSTVRANPRGSVGFLKDWCRCNVAITRARNGLIVVGNERTLRSEKRSWAPWLDYVFAHGCAVGFPQTGVYDKERVQAMATGEGRWSDFEATALAGGRVGPPVLPPFHGDKRYLHPAAPGHAHNSMQPLVPSGDFSHRREIHDIATQRSINTHVPTPTPVPQPDDRRYEAVASLPQDSRHSRSDVDQYSDRSHRHGYGRSRSRSRSRSRYRADTVEIRHRGRPYDDMHGDSYNRVGLAIVDEHHGRDRRRSLDRRGPVERSRSQGYSREHSRGRSRTRSRSRSRDRQRRSQSDTRRSHRDRHRSRRHHEPRGRN